MGVVEKAAEIFRDFRVDGNPRSGAYQTKKNELREFAQEIADALAAIVSEGVNDGGKGDVVVSAGGTQWDVPGAAKAWGLVSYSGGVPTLVASHGIAGIADTGTGVCTVTLSEAMASTLYGVQLTARHAAAIAFSYTVTSATVFVARAFNPTTAAAVDPTGFFFAIYGDLA